MTVNVKFQPITKKYPCHLLVSDFARLAYRTIFVAAHPGYRQRGNSTRKFENEMSVEVTTLRRQKVISRTFSDKQTLAWRFCNIAHIILRVDEFVSFQLNQPTRNKMSHHVIAHGHEQIEESALQVSFHIVLGNL